MGAEHLHAEPTRPSPRRRPVRIPSHLRCHPDPPHRPDRRQRLPLVRPYLLTPDERHLQRERRRALYLATLGIDTGQDHIPGIPGIPGIPAIPAIRVGAAR